MNDISYICLSGGGIRGIAYGGAARALEEHGLVPQIKGVVGTSAGSIVAALFAVGYRSADISTILAETDFNKFKDSPWGTLGALYRFVNYYGLFEGDTFEAWVEGLLKEKTGTSSITFAQVYESKGIDLVMVGSNLTKRICAYFSHRDTPNLPVSKAVRISMSYPDVYKPVSLGGDLYVDGGLTKNYDVGYFDRLHPDGPFYQTLGLKLMTQYEEPGRRIYTGDEAISNVMDYNAALVSTLQYQVEREYMTDDEWERSVIINTGDIPSMDFSITDVQKQQLIDEGYRATVAFLQSLSNKTSSS